MRISDWSSDVCSSDLACFADGIARDEISMDDLFDKQLRPIEGSNPQQFMTRYIPFLDKHLPPLHDPVLELDPRMVFCAPTDHNQLIPRSEEHTSELQSLMRIPYAVFCLKKTKHQ